MDANNHELRPSLAMLGVDSQHYNCIFVTFVFPNFLAVKVDLVLKMKLGGIPAHGYQQPSIMAIPHEVGSGPSSLPDNYWSCLLLKHS